MLGDITSGVSKQTINSALRKLESEGVIYLEAFEGRKKKVYLTDNGRQLAKDTVLWVIEAFTALNDGLTSALISFLRSLLFQVAAVLILPLIFGIDGIWFSVVAAELVAAVMTILFIAAKKKKYHY